ncbi:MAG: tetratricopeptide repeat protein [Bacteroidota bacterium]|nr:tetratricopeptide repeat protein [Bacteroidota bacterium]
MPDKPQNFWQELKRRKVIRVIIGYAAASYVILELISIISDPFGLPDWTLKLVFVLLCVGFIISVVISWLYDITPDGVQKTKPAKNEVEKEKASKPSKRGLKISDIVIAVLLIAVIVLIYPKIFKPDKLEEFREKGEISIAVMPFQNLSGDTLKNFWQVMVQENLITLLSNAEVLNIRQPESISILLQNSDIDNYDSITPSVAKNVSEKLEAGVYISGSINSLGEKIRINAKLVDSESEEIFKSFTIEGVSDSIIYLTDSLSVTIKNYFIITILQKEVSPYKYTFYGLTRSPEALRYLVDGRNAFSKGDYPTSKEYLLDAIKIDPNFIAANVTLTWNYYNSRKFDQAKKMCLKLYAKRNQMTRYDEAKINYIYAWLFETPWEVIKAVKQLLEIDDQDPSSYYVLGQSYFRLHEYEKSIPEFEKALDIFKK